MCSRVEQCVMWASHLFHHTKHNSGFQIFFPKEFLSVFINKSILFTIIPPNIEAFQANDLIPNYKSKIWKKIV